MGMDLVSNDGKRMRFLAGHWDDLLRLAEQHGWKPMGTEAFWYVEWGTPADQAAEIARQAELNWDGNYWSNDWQTVTAQDARNLGDALELALPDFPDHDALEHKRETVHTVHFGPIVTIPHGTPVSIFEVFSGPEKQYLRDFIAVCRAGEFYIR